MILRSKGIYLLSALVVVATTLSIVALQTLNSSPLGRADASMLGVLHSTPGAKSPQLVASKLDEADRPYLEYFADEKAHWYGPTDFISRNPSPPLKVPLNSWPTYPAF
jgi:hypothetical protein